MGGMLLLVLVLIAIAFLFIKKLYSHPDPGEKYNVFIAKDGILTINNLFNKKFPIDTIDKVVISYSIGRGMNYMGTARVILKNGNKSMKYMFDGSYYNQRITMHTDEILFLNTALKLQKYLVANGVACEIDGLEDLNGERLVKNKILLDHATIKTPIVAYVDYFTVKDLKKIGYAIFTLDEEYRTDADFIRQVGRRVGSISERIKNSDNVYTKSSEAEKGFFISLNAALVSGMLVHLPGEWTEDLAVYLKLIKVESESQKYDTSDVPVDKIPSNNIVNAQLLGSSRNSTIIFDVD